MIGNDLPILTVAATGFAGLCLIMVCPVMVARGSGREQAMHSNATRRWMSGSTLLVSVVFAIVGLILCPLPAGTADGQKDTREPVKQPHGALATEQDSSRPRSSPPVDATEHAKSIGYSEEDIRNVPRGVMCRGCGNPIALAAPKAGETVLDLGCGGGFDAFLASQKAGFRQIEIVSERAFPTSERDARLRGRIISIQLKASK